MLTGMKHGHGVLSCTSRVRKKDLPVYIAWYEVIVCVKLLHVHWKQRDPDVSYSPQETALKALCQDISANCCYF